MHFAYGIILWAYKSMPAGYVASLRESSIIIATILGFFFLPMTSLTSNSTIPKSQRGAGTFWSDKLSQPLLTDHYVVVGGQCSTCSSSIKDECIESRALKTLVRMPRFSDHVISELMLWPTTSNPILFSPPS